MNPEQHRTPNAEMSKDSRCHSMFGVGCSMLDVHGEGQGEGLVLQRRFPALRRMNQEEKEIVARVAGGTFRRLQIPPPASGWEILPRLLLSRCKVIGLEPFIPLPSGALVFHLACGRGE